MSDLIKRKDVIELIKNSYYDLANSEDDMWAMVADVEKLPVIETEGNGLKSDFEVMDALIASLYEELSNISYGWLEAQRMLNKLEFQYELLKKEHKQSVEAVPVIRCKDCKHYVDEQCDRYADETLGYVHSTQADGYCWVAERKEE